MANKFKNMFMAGLAAGTMSGSPADTPRTQANTAITSPKTHGTDYKIVFDSYINDLIRYEGSIAYQRAKGMYRGGKFYPYKDSKGYWTVGYGHKILPNENFKEGITEQQANQMLRKDAIQSWTDALHLLREHKVQLTEDQRESIMRILPNMIFQMGKQGVREFPAMWEALQKGDFKEASKEMLDSKWAREDSPGRAKELAGKMRVIPQTR